MLKKIHFWIKNARDTALPQSLLPALTAMFMARGENGFSWLLALAAVFGVIFGHLGMNLFDDYFDYRHKGAAIRDKLAAEGIRARIAKCDYLTSGKATMKELFWAATIFGLLALVLGGIIAMNRGVVILWVALATFIIGMSYSAPPLKLSYRGLGELTIGLIFGPMLMFGVYYAACGQISNGLIFVSIPVGLLVSNIVYTHSIMDYEPDKRVGKNTFAVLLRTKKRMLIASFMFIFVPYLMILLGVIINFLSLYYLLVVLTLPMAISLFGLIIQYTKDPQKKFLPKWYMGPMEKWDAITAAGIDWFMIRWYLARNLITFFSLIIIIASFFVI